MGNIPLFARALYQLHLEDILKDPVAKDPVKMFIRRASESRHFHLTTRYRSRAAEGILRGQTFRSGAHFQRFCVSQLRHEHVVPGEVVYRIIFDAPDITELWLEQILARYSVRATITRDEDARLRAAGLGSKMPAAFWDRDSADFQNPMARYTHIGLGPELVERMTEAWDIA